MGHSFPKSPELSGHLPSHREAGGETGASGASSSRANGANSSGDDSGASEANANTTNIPVLHAGLLHFTPNPSRSYRDVVQPPPVQHERPGAPQDCRGNHHQRYKLSAHNNVPRRANTASYTKAKQGPGTSPKATRNNNPTQKKDYILIGDSITKHVKLAKAENLCLGNTSVRELLELLPSILNTRPSRTKIVIHSGSFDILRKKTGTETLKEDFTHLMNTLNKYQHVSISGPIACFRRGQEAFSRLLNFNSWLAKACHVHGLRFIDNFNVFWNCADRFQPDGFHPNRLGSRLLAANLCHALVATKDRQQIPTREIITAQHIPTPISHKATSNSKQATPSPSQAKSKQ